MKNFVNVLLWLRNFISPFLISVIVGGIIYLSLGQSPLGIVLGAVVIGLGFVVGIYFAERVRRGYGSDLFNAIPMATTDLKHLHKEK